jgi:uncharacterized protein (DUF362 family)
MISFVDIDKVYDKVEDRNIDYLSKVYQNKSFLRQVIQRIIDKHINENEIYRKKILLKPNWVRHNIKETDKICLCTNENFILVILEVLLEKCPKSITIGDAPIQGCNWEKLLSRYFYDKIIELSDNYSVPILIKDFRRVIIDKTTNTQLKERHSLDNYLIFDVGKKSYLEPITSNEKLFRVTCYDYERLAQSHSIGVHKYCVIKDLFDADVVITIPKIKTHQKAGITNAMKILVGINGDKDYLPHHRKGSKERGGDCYPGYHFLRSVSEYISDRINKEFGKGLYNQLNSLSRLLFKLSNPKPEQNLVAGWYGNDTIWRTVYDLNLIALYGKKDGTLSDTPQRMLYSLCDGIVGGQGNGPLSPDPLALGMIAFSNDAELMDLAVGHLFHLQLEKIPVLNQIIQNIQNREYEIFFDNNKITIDELSRYATDVIMPPGWVNYNQ